MIFKNREEAGRMLADKLIGVKTNAVIYALPRGGVVVGAEAAKKLKIPLEAAIVKKIGSPFNPEYAICAISEGGDIACNESEKRAFGEDWFRIAVEKAKDEIDEKIQRYRLSKKITSPRDKTVILIDDGIATGLTMRAAIRWAKKEGAKKIIVAVPVMPKDVADQLKNEVDEVISEEIAEDYLGSVGSYYLDFEQIGDDEVKEHLSQRYDKV